MQIGPHAAGADAFDGNLALLFGQQAARAKAQHQQQRHAKGQQAQLRGHINQVLFQRPFGHARRDSAHDQGPCVINDQPQPAHQQTAQNRAPVVT